MADPIVGNFGRLTDRLAESARQEAADDANYPRNGIYFFELTAPVTGVNVGTGEATTSGGNTVTFMLPLILNPESIRIEDKFTTSKHYTGGGGFYVEESGTVERMLTIKGHTGFKPRSGRASAFLPTVRTKVEDPSFNPRSDTGFAAVLSGQKHFQFLQDKIFRTYADLKRSKEYAKDTSMVFHMPKDGEHWRIIPERFTLVRDTRRKFLYQYEIVATIVGPAVSTELLVDAEDKSVFDFVDDLAKTVQGGIDVANAAVADVEGYIDDLNNIVQGTVGTLSGIASNLGDLFNNITSLVSSIESVIVEVQRGATRLVGIPLQGIIGTIDALESLARTTIELPINVRDSVRANFQQLQDAFSAFAIHTDAYDEAPKSELELSLQRYALGSFGASQADLDAAAANPPSTVYGRGQDASGLSPGDAIRAKRRSYVQPRIPDFQSAEIRTVGYGDTLATLAARHLGDTRRWREIAALNQLQPPYVSDSGAPGTVRPGDNLLMPSSVPALRPRSAAGIYGVPLTADAEEKTLGRDLTLVEVDPGQFDFVIDTSAGSTDFLTSAGFENLKQAILTRLTIERGSDALFRNLGYKRIVGFAIPDADRELVRLRLSEAIREDPRVTGIRHIEVLEDTSPDTLRVQVEVDVMNITEPVRLLLPSTARTTGAGG